MRTLRLIMSNIMNDQGKKELQYQWKRFLNQNKHQQKKKSIKHSDKEVNISLNVNNLSKTRKINARKPQINHNKKIIKSNQNNKEDQLYTFGSSQKISSKEPKTLNQNQYYDIKNTTQIDNSNALVKIDEDLKHQNSELKLKIENLHKQSMKIDEKIHQINEEIFQIQTQTENEIKTYKEKICILTKKFVGQCQNPKISNNPLNMENKHKYKDIFSSVNNQNLKDSRIEKLKKKFKIRMKMLDESFEKTKINLKNSYDIQTLEDKKRIEEKNSLQIQKIKHLLEEESLESKKFHQTLTIEHTDILAQCTAELEETNAQLIDYQVQKENLINEIKEIETNLEKKKLERNENKQVLSDFQKEDKILKEDILRINQLETQIHEAKQRYSRLEKSFQKMEQERDALLEKFQSSVHFMKQKTECMAGDLEQKAEEFDISLQLKQDELNKILEPSEITSLYSDVSDQIGDILWQKNKTIEHLESELEKATIAHNKLMVFYQTKNFNHISSWQSMNSPQESNILNKNLNN